MVHITLDVPKSMKREFKVLCAEYEDNMSDVLREKINDYISSKKKHIVKA